MRADLQLPLEQQLVAKRGDRRASLHGGGRGVRGEAVCMGGAWCEESSELRGAVRLIDRDPEGC